MDGLTRGRREDGTLDLLTRRRFMTRSAGALAAVTGAGGLLAACGGDDNGGSEAGSSSDSSGGSKGSSTVQVINILPPQLGYTAEYIADMDGYWKKEGLEVKVNTARGSAPAIQAVLSGTALLSWVGWLESVLAIANEGAPIQAVAFTGRRSPLAIVSDKAKPINTPQDLVGKRIGIPSKGGTSETTVDLMLSANNIPPDQVQRQVTGFTPGTFELIKRGRIAGFVIGASQEEQFRQAQPSSTFMETEQYVTDGLTYITSQKGLQSNKETIQAYLRALKGAMEQVLNDKETNFATTIKKLRSKYDFEELKDDKVAQYYINFISSGWVVDGEDKLLKVDPAEWKKTYDAAVKVEAAKPGVDVTQNLVPGLI
jgi:ABC-type nitrate/sulfonate/bicarbonate transport system substrate-binding protein